MSESLERRLQELRDMAGKFARAEAQKTYLEQYRKSKLAMLQKDALREGHDSVAAQDREARSHPDYIELLEGLKVATEEAERLRWELHIARLGAELWRTSQANQRAERKGYGA